MISLRLPEINAPTTDGQIRQIRSYLYQLTELLNLSLDSIDGELEKQRQTVTSFTSASDSPEGKLNTFNSVKSLIIKSADIIKAYTEEITRQLDGMYVAESEFGTYTEETAQKITENSEGINRLFDDLQTISGTVDGIAESSILTSAYIKTGYLDSNDDGTRVYGVEVGQTTTVDGEEKFNAFARFSANRLSFYDNNGEEVAYISDYRLYITNATIKGSLALGKFIIDTSNGFAVKWAGG